MQVYSRICFMTALVLLLSCGPSSDNRPEANLFDPRELGEYDGSIPSGERPAAHYPWADPDKPVYLHTLEESEATRDEWEPLYEQIEDFNGRANNSVWGWEIYVRLHHDWDEQLEEVTAAMLSQRGVFYGLDSPLNHSYLHIFECTGEASDAVYLVEDVLVECRGPKGMNLFVRTGPPPEDAERIRQDPEVSSPWFEWWKEILAHAKSAWRNRQSPDKVNHYLQGTLYVYASQDQLGVRAKRRLEVTKTVSLSLPSDSDDGIYWGPYTSIPPEFCTIDLNSRNVCLGERE
ncbi:MAG: hypothetical protein ACLFVJ_21660 [Persicimonas sp.]